tara:strand:- start:373 stop:564 length:192 start_codon:yes stop_codon:yes gene_type:complete
MPTYTQTTTGDAKPPIGGSKTDARKTAPKPREKSGGSSAPKTKRKYEKKKMSYWNAKNRKKKN